LRTVNDGQEHNSRFFEAIDDNVRRDMELPRSIDSSRLPHFGEAFELRDGLIDLANDARGLDRRIFGNGIKEMGKIVRSSFGPPNFHSLGSIHPGVDALFEPLSSFFVRQRLAVVRCGNGVPDLGMKPFVVADQSFNGVEHDRLSITPLVGGNPREFSFQFRREFQFHGRSLFADLRAVKARDETVCDNLHFQNLRVLGHPFATCLNPFDRERIFALAAMSRSSVNPS
jgi:hypothetical protein